MKRRFAIAVLVGWGLLASAQPKAYNAPSTGNPFIPGYFADPTIRKFGDTYYLYGRWAMFFDGTQRLESEQPVAEDYRYNAPYTISALVYQTKVEPLSTVASLSTSWNELATTELRLGTDSITGILNHNGKTIH